LYPIMIWRFSKIDDMVKFNQQSTTKLGLYGKNEGSQGS
jgi:hypothetical protein